MQDTAPEQSVKEPPTERLGRGGLAGFQAARPLPPVSARGLAGTLTPPEIIAGAACLLWLLVVGGGMLLGGGNSGDGLGGLAWLVVLVLPVAMTAVAVMALRSARIMRAETRRLAASVDALRQAMAAGGRADGRAAAARSLHPASNPAPNLAPNPASNDAPSAASGSAAQHRTSPARSAPPPAVIRVVEEQPSLGLGGDPAEDSAPLDAQELIRALNFPESDQDTEGFAALRRALKDRQMRKLIQASQDVLTLLSQDAIYMDDLRPDRARPEVWRSFARGERGRAVTQLGGINDRSCLALTMTRMREDTIFRDTAHHFMRLFDKMLTSFEQEASDGEIAALAETRTARAFMLFGRVTGAFD